MTRRSIPLVLAALLASACGSDKPVRNPLVEDGGTPASDATPTDDGATEVDTGSAPFDGGPSPDDGAPAPTDGGPAPTDGGPAPTDAGPAGMPGDELGAFMLTFYWVTVETEFSGPADTDIFDEDCNVIATVPAAFADDIALEGTGRLADGRMLNVSGSCGCDFSPCFFELDADHPWGVGVANRPLIPFRSIAIDRSVLTIGTSYYVAELDGLTMPGDAPWGDFVHDGCVLADDVGGGIDGMHIDFFSAQRELYRILVGELPGDVTLYEGGTLCP